MSMQSFFQNIDELYRTGNSERAMKLLCKRLDGLRNAGRSQSADYATLLNELGGYYRNMGQYSDALRCQLEAISVLQALGLSRDCGFATLLCNTSATYRLVGDGERSLSLLREAEALAEETDGDAEQRAAILNQLCLTLLANGKCAEALAAGERALQMVRQCDDNEHELATALNNLSAVCLHSGDQSTALSYINQALTIYAAMADPNIHYATALATKGGILYALGSVDEALAAYREALRWSAYFWGDTSGEYASCCRNLAIACFAIKDQASAVSYMERASEVYADLYGQDSEKAVACRQLVDQYRGISL